MKTCRSRWRVVAALWLLGGVSLAPPLRAEKMVVVRSSVDAAYNARRTAKNPPPVETYAFIRGKYFNAIPMDRYLERMSFRTICSVLAHDLKEQRYEAASDMMKSDLMLLVHWGVTLENDTRAAQFAHDPGGLQAAADAFEAARAANDDLASQTLESRTLEGVAEAALALKFESSNQLAMHERSEGDLQSNAQLLGFANSIYEEDRSPFPTSLGETLRLMVNEERYFIIVIAYDGPALREGRKRRLWTTRMSIRAAGVNFAVALDRLSAAGGNFHGRQHSGLAFEAVKDRFRLEQTPGKVEIGEMIVVGEAIPRINTPAPTRDRKN